MRTCPSVRLILGAAALAAILAVPPASAKNIKVKTTLQDAVDAAKPGDTVTVPRGTYHESVLVTTSNLKIKGAKDAVLEATGHDFGIVVGNQPTGDPPVFPGCSPVSVHNFTLDGLTVANAEDTGLFMRGVDGFRITGGRYQDNGEYGIFPRCSRDGRIDHNSGGGGLDATIYVGVDDNVLVEHNTLTAGEIGIELEDTLNTLVRHNDVAGNVAGIFVIVLPGLPRTSTDNAVIEHNRVTDNNLPNPFTPPPPFDDDLQLLPTGTGILNVGGHGILIRHNVVTGNNTVGIGVVTNPFGFGPSLDTQVRDNNVRRNGLSPDLRDGPGAGDLLYDGTGTGNCFAKNRFDTEFPPGIVAAFPCP
jgi:parallel beta-helix repeat protein